VENKSIGVYAAIAKVMAVMASEGIGKSRKNQQQGYNFRGIDDVYNSLARPMVDAGLVVLPRVLSRECKDAQTKSGGNLFYVVVECEFDFIAVSDGSKHTVKTYGEAMDSADKATNKAMSAAMKYAYMQAFCIPTEGDNDADSHAHDVLPVNKQPPLPKQPTKPVEPKRLSNDERELCVKDMKAAPDLSALQQAVKDAHALAKSIGDKESIAFFNECYKSCEAAFAA
jgi:hypothetical protein